MPEQPTPLDLDAIEARALAATPGPWDCEVDEHNVVVNAGTARTTWTDHGEFSLGSPASSWNVTDRILEHDLDSLDEDDAAQHEADAENVAGMDPATTLALVAELRSALRDRQLTAEENRDLLAEILGLTPDTTSVTAFHDVLAERARQDAKWGQQNHADGTGPLSQPLYSPHSVIDEEYPAVRLASLFQTRCERRFAIDRTARGADPAGTWTDIFLEEVFEALAEDDPAKLRAELVQSVAVGVAWIEAIDRRTAGASAGEEAR